MRKCHWCDIIFQVINATKSISRVLGTRGMNIKSHVSDIDKPHLSRYKDLKLPKASNEGFIKEYSHKMIPSISSLQSNSL